MSIVEQAKDFIQPAIIGAVAYLFTSISDLRHNQDQSMIHIEQNRTELNDVWTKYNKNEEDEKIEMQKEFDFALKLIEKQHELEIKQKDLEIQLSK
jgi:hypothetical protein